MKSPFTNRVVYLFASLVFVLLLGNQSLACLIPSLSEMGKGQAMECCTEHCRMDTTPRAAQEACQQSSQVFSQQETLSSPSGVSFLTIFKSLPDFCFQHIFQSSLLESVPLLPKAVERGFRHRFQTVEIYTLIHSFLI